MTFSHKIKILFSLSIAHVLVECFTGFWPVFKHLAQLDLFMAGFIATSTSFCASILQPFFGHWADHGRQRKIVLIGTILSSLMMLVGPLGQHKENFGTAFSYGLIFLIVFSARIGHSMFHPPGVSTASMLFERHQARSLAFFTAFGWLGIAFSQVLFSWMYLHWQGHTEIILLPTLFLFVWIIVWYRPSRNSVVQRISLRKKWGQLATMRHHLFLLFTVIAFISALNNGLIFLLPEFLESQGYPLWFVQGGAFGFMIAGSAVGVIPAGYLADLYGKNLVLKVSLILSAISYFILLWKADSGVMVFTILCFIFGAFMASVQTIGVSLGQALAPQNKNMVSGIMMGWVWAFGSLTPLFMGYASTYFHITPEEILIYLGLLNVLAIIGGYLLPTIAESHHHKTASEYEIVNLP